jgi:hypothetical protein
MRPIRRSSKLLVTSVALVASALVAVVPIATASADTVFHFTAPYQFTNVDTSCGFPIIVSGTGQLTFNVQFDNQGNFVAFIRVGTGSAITTFTNPANGYSVSSPASPFVVRVMPDGSTVLVGAQTRLAVPGVGNLAFDTGRFLIDPNTGQLIQLAGQSNTDPNQSIFATAGVCAVFANPPTLGKH